MNTLLFLAIPPLHAAFEAPLLSRCGEVDALVSVFSAFGEVLLVRKRRGVSGPKRDGPKRFLGSFFVEFKTPEAMQRAVDAAKPGGLPFKSTAAPSGQASGEASGEDLKGDSDDVTKEHVLRCVPITEWLVANKERKGDSSSTRDGPGFFEVKHYLRVPLADLARAAG